MSTACATAGTAESYEPAAQLRALPGLAGVRLGAVTRYGQASDRRNTRHAGAMAISSSPVDIDGIEATLKSASS
jgi:hypothetical protein